MVFDRIRGLFASPAPVTAAPTARTPEGVCVYAIGDVHGRADLLATLLDRVAADAAARDARETHVILLGDLVDRGAQSKQAIDLCLDTAWGDTIPHFVAGNHEEMMLAVVDGSVEAVRHWMRNGGDAAMASYGVPEELIDGGTSDELLADFVPRVPAEHLGFLRTMKDQVRIGDYLFVHAGIRPGVAFDRQRSSDLRWIRGRFLEFEGDHGAVVVHGHTITETVDERANRIGIDTGAYRSGRLTAIGLHGAERWYLATGDA